LIQIPLNLQETILLLLPIRKKHDLKKKHLYNERSRISTCSDFLFLLVVLVLMQMYSFILNCNNSVTVLKAFFSNVTIKLASKFISDDEGCSVCFLLPYSISDF